MFTSETHPAQDTKV